MKAADLLKKTLKPLLFLNGAMALVGAFYMLNADLFRTLWMGVMLFGFSLFLFPVLLFPSALFAGFMGVFEKNKPFLSKVMMGCSIGWFVIVISFYMTVIFRGAAGLIGSPLEIPALLWVSGAGAFAWIAFALKDPDNLFVASLILMLETACVIICFFAEANGFGFGALFGWFFGIMGALVTLQSIGEKICFDRKKKAGQ